jgi:uncharacterized protein with HEPN domain
MLPSLIEFLGHIQQELAFVLKNTNGLSFDEFITDEILTRAVARSMEIVGEACKNVPDEIRYTHKEFNWKGFAGLRDRVIHQYWGVDYELLWDAIENEVPTEKEWIDQIIEIEKQKSNHNE